MHKKLNTNTKKEGFTLIELIIAIAIIGILFAFVAPNLGGNIGKAKDGARQMSVKSLASLVEQHKIFEGSYPNEAEIYSVMGDNGFDLPADADTCFYYGFDNDNDKFFIAAKSSEESWISQASLGVTLNGSASCEAAPGLLTNEEKLTQNIK